MSDPTPASGGQSQAVTTIAKLGADPILLAKLAPFPDGDYDIVVSITPSGPAGADCGTHQTQCCQSQSTHLEEIVLE